MKWHYETQMQLYNYMTNWHPYFAWWPASSETDGKTYWLEMIYRRKEYKLNYTYVYYIKQIPTIEVLHEKSNCHDANV